MGGVPVRGRREVGASPMNRMYKGRLLDNQPRLTLVPAPEKLDVTYPSLSRRNRLIVVVCAVVMIAAGVGLVWVIS